MSLDALRTEIAVKRKTISDESLSNTRPNKYMRKGELDKLKAEQERKEDQERRELQDKERKANEAVAVAGTMAKVCSP